MKLRTQILLFFFLFGLIPLVILVLLNLPLVLERMELFYHKAYLQNLRADFRDLDQHLASRDEMVRLLAKLPEPGTLLSEDGAENEESIDMARARYTQWINQILQNQLDIIQIVFFDQQGRERFWLDRDKTTQEWQPTIERPEPPNRDFVRTALETKQSGALVSPISLNPIAGASDPRRFMTLRLISSITHREANNILGAVMISIDVGGIARYYRNTLWVHNDGTFLQHAGPNAPQGNAFTQFPGLQPIFNNGKLALWEGAGKQIIWIPMFHTEQSGALWVGRQVDPSPIAQFRNALTVRVLTIVFALMVVVWFVARWFARRADHVSHQLIDRVQRILKGEQVSFNWGAPQELKELGESLSRLAVEHGRNIRNLKEHARKLEESNRYKSEFLANVSHELRTPLNSILLLSKLLAAKKSGLSPEQTKQAKVIHEAGSDLQTLIDNILDLSRIEAQRTTLELEFIQVPQMLEDLLGLVQPQFEAKGLTLQLEIADNTPRRIHSDKVKLGQIIKNFLSNAVKFTEQGGVTVRLEGSDRQEASDWDLKISVQDTGIGIPSSKQHHIFDAFKQADGSTSRRYGGTGLGLAISQQLAKLLGGRIELKSAEGEGSNFCLLLPVEFHAESTASEQPEVEQEREALDLWEKEQQEPLPSAATESEIGGHRILLVDDDVRNLLSLTPLLEQWGLEVTAAGDVNEALEVLEEDDEFSIVLIDIMMPDQDGYDTIRRIRQDERFQNLAVIALVANSGDRDRENCVEAGADDFIIQPVDSKELEQTIARHLPFKLT